MNKRHGGSARDCNGDDSAIDITRARYRIAKDEMTVWATSNLGDKAGLQVRINLEGGGTVDKTMGWSSKKTRWQRTIKDFQSKFGAAPASVTVAGAEGMESAPIE